MKTILLLTLACIFFSAHSQQINKTIYFENDEYVLDENDQGIISALIEFIQDDAKEIITIEIYGFADTSASVNYNKDLSKKRCDAVIASLSPGLPKKLINKVNIHWYGELKPESTKKDLHYSKRCVDIVIHYKEIKSSDNISELFDQLRDPSQKFRIDPTKDTILKGDAGTIISINANTFYIPKSCAGEMVDIVLTESYDQVSMLINNLSTMSGKLQLETDGMIFLNAQVCNRILTVKENMPITVMFPTRGPKEGMDLFFGKKTDSGNINWVVANNGLSPIYNYEIEDLLNRYDFYEKQFARVCPLFFCKIQNFFSGGDIDHGPEYAYSTFEYKQYRNYVDSICKVYGVRSLYQLRNLMEERKMRNFESRIGRGEIDKNEWNYYLTKTTNLGWMNCDRFNDVPEVKKTNVIVQQKPADNISISLVFTEYKSMMNSNNITNDYYGFNSVEKKNICYVVILKYENKIPWMSIQKVTITPNLVVEPEFKQYTVEDMKKELQRLNG